MLIYGLTEPDGLTIRYVGKTGQGLERRMREHLDEALRLDTHKCRWIRSLQKRNLNPGIIALEACEKSDVDEREKAWIKKLDNLTNATEGGDGGEMSPEIVAKRNRSIREGWKNGRKHPFKGRKHSPEAKAKMRAAALRRMARGDSPLCDPEHQKKASKAAKASWAGETKEKLAAQCRKMAKKGAEARWGER